VLRFCNTAVHKNGLFSQNGFFKQNRNLLRTANLFAGEQFEGWHRSDELNGEKAQQKKPLPRRHEDTKKGKKKQACVKSSNG
jgi:hypothetical protein